MTAHRYEMDKTPLSISVQLDCSGLPNEVDSWTHTRRGVHLVSCPPQGKFARGVRGGQISRSRTTGPFGPLGQSEPAQRAVLWGARSKSAVAAPGTGKAGQ